MENPTLRAEPNEKPQAKFADSAAELHRCLVDARKRIEREDDWKRHALGGHCVTTAIAVSTRSLAIEKAAIDWFAQQNNLGPSLGDIWGWNDAAARTHAEVLAAFDKAIAATGGAQ